MVCLHGQCRCCVVMMQRSPVSPLALSWTWLYPDQKLVTLKASQTSPSPCCHKIHVLLHFLRLSQDGTVIVHSVRRGQYLRTLRPPCESCVSVRVNQLQVGMEGHLVAQTILEGCTAGKASHLIYFSGLHDVVCAADSLTCLGIYLCV